MLFTLLVTCFINDYKPRGDWSVSDVYVFRTKKEAENKLRELIIEHMLEHGMTEQDCKKLDLEQVINLFTEVDKPEYIVRTMGWQIKEHELSN
ncbi:MAG: hypothetical protein JSS09_09200 [Verrucomicrobia bacterium]|nr:hypothetical protein [Verrucomicrobiota bacterium]